MELQAIINLGAGLLLAVFGWLARELWGAVKDLRDDVQALEVTLTKDYVSKSDFTTALERVEKGLARIYDKLDGKADK